MSQSSDDAPTGPITGDHAQQTATTDTDRAHPPAGAAAAVQAPRRAAVVIALTAAALLVVAPLLPWNLYFGIGATTSRAALFWVLLGVTALSLISVALGASRRPAGGIRFWLQVPYLLLVLAFVGFDAFETVRFGGTVTVPGGVGPGAWVGVAGALLGAQPSLAGPDEAGFQRWVRSARIIGYASILGALASFGFNLYWRVRYAVHNPDGSSGFGQQNIAVIATAVVYGVVALIAVVVASRWLLRSSQGSRLETVALGSSALLAGIVVWTLPVGRDIDAFHGIAQNTSTAGVGFEGYLAWAAAAAIFAPRALSRQRHPSTTEENAWRTAARNGLLLIAVWCLGSVAMRINDLVVAITLDYPFSRYDTLVLAGFDLVTAVLAIWLRRNLVRETLSARLTSSLCGLVATLSIARIVIGVALAPRFAQPPTGVAENPVYGNDLAQQITSLFDVTLSVLGLCILAAAIVTGHFSGRRLRRQRRRAAGRPTAAAAPRAAQETTRIPVGTAPPSAAATTRIPTDPHPAHSPRIFRGDDSATSQIPVPKPHIYRPPNA
ncbi:hypothetical protein [Mycobacterium shigaense]|uniref:DUF7937 domain-containing protein n=1 Tax=Mycobacterium shigaense TaxID=722731 RepID=UPI000E58EDCD|nr:hypothetical protein [Mycobacterium shigaense]